MDVKTVVSDKGKTSSFLSIGCYNIKGAMRNVMYLDKLLNEYKLDICVISEHWLFEESLGFLDSVSSNYLSYGISDCTLNPLDPYRRGKGGVAIMWKDNLTPNIKKIDCDNDRLIGISLQLSESHSITIIGVYLPDSNYGDEVFSEYIDKLQDLYHMYSGISDVIIVGDLNTHIDNKQDSVNRSPRQNKLLEAIDNLGLVPVTTLDICKGPGYSFCGYVGGPKTLIDQILIKETKVDLLEKCEIVENATENLSDHLPLIVKLNIEELIIDTIPITKSNYQWQKLTQVQKHGGYGVGVDNALTVLDKPEFTCVNDIEKYYGEIKDTMTNISDRYVPKSKYKKYQKPYWRADDNALNDLHHTMRERRIDWLREGRPRGYAYQSYTLYKEAKRQFRKKMRQLAQKAEKDFYDTVEEAAEMDQKQFWRLINQKKKQKGNCVYELKVNDKILRKPKDILNSWEEHFSDLYSGDSGSEKFDNQFYIETEREFIRLQNGSQIELNDILADPVDNRELECILKKLKMGKSSGPDGLTNEHLKYGGNVLKDHLVHLFNGMIQVEKIPRVLKRGFLLTLHKGSNKYKDDRKNHRGITLLNTLYKMFEQIMLQRMKTWAHDKGIVFPSDQQGAYQQHLCSTMTSFNVQETIAYYMERNSKIYLSLLDTATAFDTVWHGGLFVKLHNMGIRGKAWRVLLQCYTGMETAVMFQGLLSNWIQIKRSVRQGGVLSPWLYMLFINELPEQLRESGEGASIGSLYCGSPMQADDITLISPTVNGLQRMIDIVEGYSRKWRYKLNPVKSKVIVFGENKKGQDNRLSCRKWVLNGETIQVCTEEKHVGIVLNSSFNSVTRTKDATRKGRNTLMSLLGVGTHDKGLNPCTSAHLMKCVVLPRALFGSELWNHLSNNEVAILERMLCYCCKVIQGCSRRCRSDMCRPILGMSRIQASIDIRKLTFMGRIIWLPNNILAKKVFLARITQYIVIENSGENVQRQMGFIQDALGLLKKYDLHKHMDRFISSGFRDFPTKVGWKAVIKKAVRDFEQTQWDARTANDQEFQIFRMVHNDIDKPARIWKFGKTFPEYLDKCRVVSKFIMRNPTSFVDIELCCYCGRFFNDIYVHLAIVCSRTEDERDILWSNITNLLEVECSAFLYNIEDDEFYSILLGGIPNICISKEQLNTLMKISADYFYLINKYIY